MPASEDDGWDLTAGQLEIWRAQQFAADSSLYNIGEYLEILGDLDAGVFTAAARLVVLEAEALRIRLRGEDGPPRQHIREPADWQLHIADVSGATDPHVAAREWMEQDMRRPRRFRDGWLFTMAWFTSGPERSFWYLSAHHVAVDGLGGSVIAARLAQIYTALLDGRSPASGALEALPALLAADAQYRSSADFHRDREFWLHALAGVPQAVSVSGDRGRATPRRAMRDHADVSPGDAGSLRVTARRMRTSLGGLFIAAAAIYLHRCTGEEDIVLGLSALGRAGRRERAIPGMTANVLPVRVRVTPETSLDDLARQVSRTVADALKHQRYRFEDIRRDLGVPEKSQLFSMVVDIMAFDFGIKFGDVAVIPHYLVSTPVSDLRIVMYDSPVALHLRIRLLL